MGDLEMNDEHGQAMAEAARTTMMNEKQTQRMGELAAKAIDGTWTANEVRSLGLEARMAAKLIPELQAQAVHVVDNVKADAEKWRAAQAADALDDATLHAIYWEAADHVHGGTPESKGRQAIIDHVRAHDAAKRQAELVEAIRAAPAPIYSARRGQGGTIGFEIDGRTVLVHYPGARTTAGNDLGAEDAARQEEWKSLFATEPAPEEWTAAVAAPFSFGVDIFSHMSPPDQELRRANEMIGEIREALGIDGWSSKDETVALLRSKLAELDEYERLRVESETVGGGVLPSAADLHALLERCESGSVQHEIVMALEQVVCAVKESHR